MGEPINPPAVSTDFVRAIVEEDLRSGRYDRVQTRFPPEPNGYLHIGHAKAICLDFGVALDYGGVCNLRFDDTNPTKEDVEYVDSIQADVQWLGFQWANVFYASDYFDQLYDWALRLIRAGTAYVDDQSAEEISKTRGAPGTPGKDSPYRNRPVDQNLDLFVRMKSGEFPDGSRVLRAKIDMASPNLNLRDPVLYRILHASHHRTGDKWCIYPMYDWAHGQSDSIEGVTHSICTLEFEDHRPLYDWFIEQLGVFHPRQIEFARLNLTYTMMSKRKLGALVRDGYVRGWDDPRMPTLAGLRRRGYTPEAIREFTTRVGVAKNNSTVDIALLEHVLREDLNLRAPRVMAVLRPLRVTITNYPEGQVEQVEAVNNPEDESMGTRWLPFARTIYVEREDFREDPPKGWFRLAPGREVRLKHAYYIKCEEVIKDAAGEVVELQCSYDPESRSGVTPDGRVVKGTLHWVAADYCCPAEVRLYEHLFNTPDPEAVPEGHDWRENLNPNSEQVLTGCMVECTLGSAAAGSRYQFMRQGYFCVDCDSTPERPVFNRTVGLRDAWAKVEKGNKAS